MVLAPRRRISVRPRVATGALVKVDQPVAAPGLGIDIGHAMARGIHERLVLGVGDRRARDEEALQRLGPARALAFVPAALPRAGVAVGRLVQLVGVLPLGRVGARDEGAGGNLDHGRGNRGSGVGGAREGSDGDREAYGEQSSGEGHRSTLFAGPPAVESQKFERKGFAPHHALTDNSFRTRTLREARHATHETPACRNGGPCGHRARRRRQWRPRRGRYIRRREPGGDPAASGPGRARLRLVQPLRTVQPMQAMRGGLQSLWAM